MTRLTTKQPGLFSSLLTLIVVPTSLGSLLILMAIVMGGFAAGTRLG